MPVRRDISVVIPLFNGGTYIEEALTSIADQSVRVGEIIVVDDGSTDNGASLAESHFARPRVVRQANRGPAAARNAGIRLAQNPYLAFLDQDDLWRPNKTALQCAAFDADPDLVVCFGRVDCFWDDPDCEEARHFDGHQRTTAVEGYVTTTMLARASIFETVGPFDEALLFADSIQWCAKVNDLGVKARLLDEVVLDRRMHANNLTRRRQESASEILRVLQMRRQTAQTGVRN